MLYGRCSSVRLRLQFVKRFSGKCLSIVVRIPPTNTSCLGYLKLHGTNVKEHPIFRELTRVRQYFEKLEQAEKKPTEEQPTTKLDKEAANRFIKHGLVCLQPAI